MLTGVSQQARKLILADGNERFGKEHLFQVLSLRDLKVNLREATIQIK